MLTSNIGLAGFCWLFLAELSLSLLVYLIEIMLGFFHGSLTIFLELVGTGNANLHQKSLL